MNDDRLHGLLDSAARPRRPDPDFAAALLAEIGDELGFAGTGAVRSTPGVAARRSARPSRIRRRPFDLLLIAVIAVGIAGGLVATAGAIRERLATPAPTSLLAELRTAGHVRIAIRPDHPQFMIGGQTATGFDADVAGDLARRLGLASNIVIEDEGTMTQERHGETWDIALPSVPIWTIDSIAFLASVPYYRWPHLLVVPTGSTAAGIQDVANGPICAVAGDAGESWLAGRYGGASGAPISARIVTRPTDADCLALLGSGEAIAAVTSALSAADLAVRSDIRVIGGAASEPRAMILSKQRVPDANASDLLRAVDDAIAAMGADGTLTRLSQQRFGGADLTAP